MLQIIFIMFTLIVKLLEILWFNYFILYFSREHSSLTNPPTASGIAFIFYIFVIFYISYLIFYFIFYILYFIILFKNIYLYN